MAHTIVPVITQVGKVWGRDAIFLSKVNIINESTFELIGEFNAALCSNLEEGTNRKYKIIFYSVTLFKMIETDFDEIEYRSSFDIIANSRQLLKMINDDKVNHIGKVDDTFKHYVFRTYDTVFEIVCKDFELKLE